jgi:hypothetical protein
VPKSVKTNHEGKVTILWNQQVWNSRTTPNNKLEVKIHEIKKVACMLIDSAISGDRNVIKKEAEKILKHKDFIIEIQCMWNVTTKVIPVLLIQATGTISE